LYRGSGSPRPSPDGYNALRGVPFHALWAGTIAELELPADEFALCETLRSIEDIEFETERVVAHDPDHVMPYVWASNVGDIDFDATLAEDPSVEDVEELADLGDEQLYRMGWIEDIGTLVRILVEEDGTILAAFGRGEVWALRTLFPEHAALSRTHEYCEGAGLTMDVQSVYRLDDGRCGRFGLTDAQQDTLLDAFERGYYEVPRDATQRNSPPRSGPPIRRFPNSSVEHTAASSRTRS
jgi:predicted DNA binding protein